MLEAVTNIPDHDVQRGITRVSRDHWLAREYPDCFRQAEDGPPDVIRRGPYPGQTAHLREPGSKRASTRPQSRPRLPLVVEDRVRRETLALIDREARDRNREPTEEQRFWTGAEHYLRSLDPAAQQRYAREQRDLAEQEENVRVVAQLAWAEVDAACASWPEATAQWN